MRFKIGDRVSVIFSNKKKSEINGIVGHCVSGDLYWVKFDSGIEGFIREENLEPLESVHGPAVQEPEPNHDGMTYNPYTKRWSWF